MDSQWHIRQQVEFLSSPTSIHYHRIEKYSSIVDGVRRIRRVLGGDHQSENERLLRACCRNDIDAVRWLFDNIDTDSLDLKTGINRSALHEAVLNRDGRPLVRLLFQYGADPKQRDSLGRTPIHYAASCGHIDIMIDLIDFSRVSVSTLIDIDGRCPLMYACGEGHLYVCQWLVEHGYADYHRKDDRGRSCIAYASRAGHAEIVEWFLSILPPESTNTGWHPLHYACSAGHLDVVKVLLQYDQHCGHVITHSGHSALFMAMHSTKNTIEMVKCLLDSNSSLELTSQDIHDLDCDKSLILLFAQRRHSFYFLFAIIEKMYYPLSLIRLLLLSEHNYFNIFEIH
ncbi:unnamed protein product [Rotaria socialis]|uniref:Ankyrin repeat protein n=1 Tax=Rotaria socialis TaxID=392032 RepID=A0A818LCF3_9BILA|nr:unnamed protein product [Rotaria socialis]